MLCRVRTSAEPAEGVAVDIPVSDEKTARLVPQITALPSAPPKTAPGANAHLKINPNADGICEMFMNRIIREIKI